MSISLRNRVSIALMLLALVGPAQADELSLPSLNEGSIYFWNGTNRDVVFYLSTDGSNFTKFTLHGDEAGKPSFDPNTTSIFFVAKTGDTLVRRTLAPKTRWRLVLSSGNVIDIQPLTSQ
jgi:hypothetical protein